MSDFNGRKKGNHKEWITSIYVKKIQDDFITELITLLEKANLENEKINQKSFDMN